MIDIESWINRFLISLEQYFGSRTEFVGLQGSYGRGEATDSSDIDIVVILDKLSADDVRKYNEMLNNGFDEDEQA